jgi:hypothetical protein
MHLFLPQVLYLIWCLSKLYTNTIFVKTTCKCCGRKEKKKKEEKTQIGTSVRARVFNPLTAGHENIRARFKCPKCYARVYTMR